MIKQNREPGFGSFLDKENPIAAHRKCVIRITAFREVETRSGRITGKQEVGDRKGHATGSKGNWLTKESRRPIRPAAGSPARRGELPRTIRPYQ